MAPQISLFGRELTVEVKPISALLAVLGFYILQRVVTVLKALHSTQTPSFFPVVRSAFEPFALPGAFLPTTSWNTGADWHWEEVAAGHTVTRPDAFAMLVETNQDESSKHPLDDEELLRVNPRLVLCNRTPIQTDWEDLCSSLPATIWTLGFLAAYVDDIQEQVLAVVGTDREPQFEDYSKLDKVLAIFYETARMFPAGHVLIREATDDTVLNVPNPVGEEGSRTVPISKGTQIMVDMVGAQYNPRYLEDPQTYKPLRWYGLPTDSELFTPFSVDPGACIGRRFSTVEAVCFLTHFLRDWKMLPILRDGETREEWARFGWAYTVVLTLGVRNFPLRFQRRNRA
ncbi:cytochrome P450 [Mycena galericulata]|nr:cytochrome P450 [Mycena galericulata]